MVSRQQHEKNTDPHQVGHWTCHGRWRRRFPINKDRPREVMWTELAQKLIFTACSLYFWGVLMTSVRSLIDPICFTSLAQRPRSRACEKVRNYILPQWPNSDINNWRSCGHINKYYKKRSEPVFILSLYFSTCHKSHLHDPICNRHVPIFQWFNLDVSLGQLASWDASNGNARCKNSWKCTAVMNTLELQFSPLVF